MLLSGWLALLKISMALTLSLCMRGCAHLCATALPSAWTLLRQMALPMHAGRRDRAQTQGDRSPASSSITATASCPNNMQVHGDAFLAEDLVAAAHPSAGSSLTLRLQSSVLPGGRDQLQALLSFPQLPPAPPGESAIFSQDDEPPPPAPTAALTKV